MVGTQRRVTNAYMEPTKPSGVVSVRMEPQLADAVRTRAEVEGRSFSGQLVHMVRERMNDDVDTSTPVLPITGWLSGRSTPSKRAREPGATLLAAAAKRARRT